MDTGRKMSLIAQGAESFVYRTEWFGMPVIVKQRTAKKYRHPELDAMLMKSRMKSECDLLARCVSHGVSVPCLIDVNWHVHEIVMRDISEHVSLKHFLADCPSNMDIARDVGMELARMHSAHIVHGDLTTSNILLEMPSLKVYVIDFGLGCGSSSEEDKAVDLYVLERAILGTYPSCQNFVDQIWKSYEECNKKLKLVLARLKEVRLRGRKKLCFG